MKKISLIITLFFGVFSIISQADAANWKKFTIKKYLGYDGLLISNEDDHWVIKTSYGCSISSFDEGKTIYIDTYLYPNFYDDIYFDDYFSDDTCYISNFPTKLDLNPLVVTDITSNSNHIIAYDSSANKYLIEYGFECTRYDFGYYDIIYFDSYSSIPLAYDDLYIFKTYEMNSCSIVSVSNLTNSGSLGDVLNSNEVDASVLPLGEAGTFIGHIYVNKKKPKKSLEIRIFYNNQFIMKLESDKNGKFSSSLLTADYLYRFKIENKKYYWNFKRKVKSAKINKFKFYLNQ